MDASRGGSLYLWGAGGAWELYGAVHAIWFCTLPPYASACGCLCMRWRRAKFCGMLDSGQLLSLPMQMHAVPAKNQPIFKATGNLATEVIISELISTSCIPTGRLVTYINACPVHASIAP